MNFGEKLRNARIIKGWSQVELAGQTGLSRRAIQNYENEDRLPRKRETYTVLADALGIDESVLLDENVDFVLRANEQYGSGAMQQAMNLVADVRALWAGGEMEEEDMDEIMRALQDAYWEAKEKNRKRK
jgi:transcriptional regulator with XRE-family HTH domain